VPHLVIPGRPKPIQIKSPFARRQAPGRPIPGGCAEATWDAALPAARPIATERRRGQFRRLRESPIFGEWRRREQHPIPKRGLARSGFRIATTGAAKLIGALSNTCAQPQRQSDSAAAQRSERCASRPYQPPYAPPDRTWPHTRPQLPRTSHGSPSRTDQPSWPLDRSFRSVTNSRSSSSIPHRHAPTHADAFP
jgi:hypothetical protein